MDEPAAVFQLRKETISRVTPLNLNDIPLPHGDVKYIICKNKIRQISMTFLSLSCNSALLYFFLNILYRYLL